MALYKIIHPDTIADMMSELHQCAKCNYAWLWRVPNPQRCPKCHSRNWCIKPNIRGRKMTRQTSGMPGLKYSEETFRDMYEALKNLVKRIDGGLALGEKLDVLPARDALAKAEGRG
uniref:Uncharacterized protein n=1 Tax=viral metagenome TaxID=1070528 RepID=A0A6H1ZFR2_9ZZZZ